MELEHVEYPHWPGQLYDCAACETECFCDELEDRQAACVFCALHMHVEA